MRDLKMFFLYLLVASFSATGVDARPGYLGAYRSCGHTYTEAMKKCNGAFVVDREGTYARIQIEPYGTDRWVDTSSTSLSFRKKVVRKSDWNWVFYWIRYQF